MGQGGAVKRTSALRWQPMWALRPRCCRRGREEGAVGPPAVYKTYERASTWARLGTPMLVEVSRTGSRFQCVLLQHPQLRHTCLTLPENFYYRYSGMRSFYLPQSFHPRKMAGIAMLLVVATSIMGTFAYPGVYVQQYSAGRCLSVPNMGLGPHGGIQADA